MTVLSVAAALPGPPSCPITLLDALMREEGVSDIMINRYNRIFIEKNGQLREADFVFDNAEAVETLAMALLERCGKEKSAAEHPVVESVMPDGSRLSMVLSPVALDGPSISIRRFAQAGLTLDNMTERQFITPRLGAFLKVVAASRVNLIVSGSTSSGKTTMLNTLGAHIPENERIVTIEDTPEINIVHRNVVRMETHEAGHGGVVPISSRDVIKASLRMRPDRIIMGEVRGGEAFDLLQAMNTGHDGSMATMHANNPRDAISRLENMTTMAATSLPQRAVRQQIASAVDLIIQMKRVNGMRRISHITEFVGMEGEIITSQDIVTGAVNPQTGEYDFTWTTGGSRNPKLQAALQQSLSVK